MKSMRVTGFILLGLMVLSAACAPNSTPTPSAAGTSSVGQSTANTGASQTYIDGSTLVDVPAGQFTMGHGGEDDPQHPVNLNEFWIYQTKVTNQQYGLCVTIGQCKAPDAADAPDFQDPAHASEPVVGVTWDQAAAYCAFVGGTLPSEAQWEKTARGPDGNVYPWGKAAPADDLLNFNNTIGTTTNVFNYPAGKSYYGALDMAGNAFEWTADWYDPAYYSTSPASDPTGPSTGEMRSVRGSSFKSIPDQIASAWRFSQKPDTHKVDLGFRCVVPNPNAFAPFCQTAALEFPAGSQPTPLPPYKCPPTGIDMRQPYCIGSVPAQHITIPPGGKMNVPAGLTCIKTASFNGYTDYACTGSPNKSYQISIQVSCTPPAVPVPAGQPQCASGYQYDSGTSSCVFKGSSQGNQCPPGFSFDAANACCAAQSGTDYHLCPAGQSYNDSGKACLPMLQGVIPFSTSVTMSMQDCSSSKKGGGSCAAQSCSPGYQWSAQKCSCVCSGGHC